MSSELGIKRKETVSEESTGAKSETKSKTKSKTKSETKTDTAPTTKDTGTARHEGQKKVTENYRKSWDQIWGSKAGSG